MQCMENRSGRRFPMELPEIPFPKVVRDHPLITIAVIGIVMRLLIMPFFTTAYDSNFWALIIRNFESGDGLYGLEGYYYTPIWGYFLGFWTLIQESFLSIDILGARIPEVLAINSFTDWFFTSTITTVSFNFWVKIPFVISDLVMSWLLFWIIKEKTGDQKKAILGFGLCFLCPLTVCITSVSGMFDTFSVVMTLLCVILVYRGKYFFGGAMFSMAVLTKFFPAFLIFILVAYIIKKHRSDGLAMRNFLMLAAGMVISFVILMLPQILDGTVIESFSFISNRAGDGGVSDSVIDFIMSKRAVIMYLIVILLSFVLAVRMYRKDDSPDLFKYCFIVSAFVFLYPPAPQYLVLLIPFLVYYLLIYNPKMRVSWLIISVGSVIFVMAGNAALLLSAGVYTDVISIDFVMDMVYAFQTPVAGTSWMGILYYVGGFIQYAGILSIFWYLYREKGNGSFLRRIMPRTKDGSDTV